MYREIYESLCNRNKVEREGVHLHKHHIVPKHQGGVDSDENYTYLTPREHQIAHFLLWKINRLPNDLRSMHMLGAKLTTEQRRIVGVWCAENGVGFHSEDYKTNPDYHRERTKKSAKTQSLRKVGTFDPAFRQKMASEGGKIGGKVQKTLAVGIHDPTNFRKNASLGGKAMKGMIWVTKGNHRARIKPELLPHYLQEGYRRGIRLASNT